jgi:D-alanyl-D-alanine carboxypeptidase/D-alanyl-D-alanine-endopeptidase (penicillin-binding protein 4)
VTRLRLLPLSLVLAAVAGPLAVPPPRAAAEPWPGIGARSGSFTATMARSLTATTTASPHLGSRLSGLVVDATSDAVLWQHSGGTSRIPASVQKVLTAYTVLESMPAATRLVTSTCRAARSPAAVYLRGGGDPSLTTSRIRQLASNTARALGGTLPSRVLVYVDGTIFPAPTMAPGWKSSYLRSDVQLVRGLTIAGHRGGDGRIAAGTAMVKALSGYGVTARVAGAARAPAECAPLATTSSAPTGSLVSTMLLGSNNDYAEFLLRQAALARGGTASWRGALDNELRVLAEAGIPTAGLRTFDGSGLSRANRVRAVTVAKVLLLLRRDPGHAAIVFGKQGLPRAGQTGTLAKRFAAASQKCARGKVQAKTGSLSDVVSLAGIARGQDGKARVFVLLGNGVRNVTSTRSAMDTLATTVVGCHAG